MNGAENSIPSRKCPSLCDYRLIAISVLFMSGPICTRHRSHAAPRQPSKEGNYISQESIDTSIQRGFILLNESADMAGVGFRHQRSISEAKKIVRMLKEKARGDPNEKYILWKAGELEAQIYLEESDLVMQQMQKRQLTINELVDRYNSEVGKWRPDFASLYRIHKHMDQVDVRKANELADSYNQRKRAISRETVHFLEKALLAGILDSARKELGYCLRNQLYLDISSSAYKKLEDRVEGLDEALRSRPFIAAAVASAERFLDKKNISEARKTLDSAGNLLTTIRRHLPQREAIAAASSLKRTTGRLGAMEDSLVGVNLSILRSEGVEAADKYLQSVLRARGVSREKAASVDRMIISAQSPDQKMESSGIADLDNDEPERSPVLDDIMIAAKKKAQEKMDSVRKVENALYWKEQRDRDRRDSIARSERAAEETALRTKQLQADSIAMAIYLCIEKNDMRNGRRLFSEKRGFLGRFLRKEELAMLETTIEQFTAAPAREQSDIAYLTPVDRRSQPQTAPTDPLLQRNLSRAQEEITGIYSMLERNDIERAYRRFRTNREPLRKYLAPEAFSMLELSVQQAYDYSTGKK